MDVEQRARRLIGEEVLGWRLTEYIGSGATANVFEGRRRNDRAAIKLYLPQMAEEDPNGERLQRESRVLQAINDPNVCGTTITPKS